MLRILQLKLTSKDNPRVGTHIDVATLVQWLKYDFSNLNSLPLKMGDKAKDRKLPYPFTPVNEIRREDFTQGVRPRNECGWMVEPFMP